MVGFFGWTAERGRDGSWFATKFVEKGPTRGQRDRNRPLAPSTGQRQQGREQGCCDA